MPTTATGPNAAQQQFTAHEDVGLHLNRCMCRVMSFINANQLELLTEAMLNQANGDLCRVRTAIDTLHTVLHFDEKSLMLTHGYAQLGIEMPQGTMFYINLSFGTERDLVVEKDLVEAEEL